MSLLVAGVNQEPLYLHGSSQEGNCHAQFLRTLNLRFPQDWQRQYQNHQIADNMRQADPNAEDLVVDTLFRLLVPVRRDGLAYSHGRHEPCDRIHD